MWKCLSVVILCAAGFALLGMGGLGPGAEDIPKPDVYFAATIIDKDLIEMDAEYLACDGKTSLPAYRGKAEVVVPFNRIQSVTFQDASDGRQTAKVLLKSGNTHTLQVKSILKCTGHTELGPMTIRVKDISKVQFDKTKTPPTTESGE